jgi:hypothetical protein
MDRLDRLRPVGDRHFDMDFVERATPPLPA